MALQNQLNCLKRCLLSSIRCNSSLQKQLCSSIVNRNMQNNNQLPKDQEDNNELDKNDQHESDHSCVQLFGDWTEEYKTSVLQNMLVFRDFITETEEDSIMTEIGPYLKRMRYEFDHWDDFCGSVITGISLLSDAVMRLVSCAEPTRRLDALLPRRSLYIMRHTARYDYTHELLADSESQFDGRPVPRDRRISIICRNEPPATDGADGNGTSAADDSRFTVTGGGAAAAQDR